VELLEARLTPSSQPLTVNITGVGDADRTNRNFYAVVTINGVTQDNRSQAVLGNSLFVNWQFQQPVENTAGLVPVSMYALTGRTIATCGLGG
jgi:hypothetical protein